MVGLRLHGALVLSLAVLVGCGGNGNGSTLPPTEDDFADQYYAALCPMLVRLHLVSGQQYCASLVAATHGAQAGFNSLKAHLAAVKVGKSTFDDRKAAQCIAAIENIPAQSRFDSSLSSLIDACTDVFHGMLADGERCIADGECQPGSSCYLQSGDCDGVCASPAPACPEPCSSGSVCDRYSGTCIVPAPPGANGQACGRNLSCQEGLTCSNANVCEPPPGQDQPCDNLACAEGLICGMKGVQNGVCTRPLVQGEACQWPGQCGAMIFSALTCDPASHVCAEALVGGPCSSPVGSFSFDSLLGLSDQRMQFAVGCNSLVSYCDWASTTCMAYPAIGGACAKNSIPCEPGAYCKPDETGSLAGTCTRIPTCSP